MPRGFNTARNAKTVPQIQSMAYTTGQVFKIGAVVVDIAAGTISEAGVDPQSVVGVALEGAGRKPGYDLANSADVVFTTGRLQEVSVAIADRDTQFSGRGVNGGTDPVLPLVTHIGEQYSIVKIANDWCIDIANPTTPAVEITDIVEAQGGDPGFFLFKFLEAVLARP